MTQAADPDSALIAADHRLAMTAHVLESLVGLGPTKLLDDETVARVRALAGDLAAQLVVDEAALADPVRDRLMANRAIALHLHAIAIETRLIAQLAARRALDPVLPPLIRRRLDAGTVGDDVAIATTALLAVQTRLGQSLRRMCLPLGELPGDLLHMAHAIADGVRAEHAAPVRHPRHAAPDDPHGRLALLRRVLTVLGPDTAMALRIDEAGVPLFLSALALASGQPRELVTLACAEDDPLRLALMLRATGLSPADAAAQLLAIRPEADPALVALPADAGAAEHVLAGQGG